MTDKLEQAAEYSAGGLINSERYEHIEGFKSGARWQQESGWIDKQKVLDILEKARIQAVKNNTHAGDYAENVLYDIIEEIEAVTPPTEQK